MFEYLVKILFIHFQKHNINNKWGNKNITNNLWKNFQQPNKNGTFEDLFHQADNVHDKIQQSNSLGKIRGKIKSNLGHFIVKNKILNWSF